MWQMIARVARRHVGDAGRARQRFEGRGTPDFRARQLTDIPATSAETREGLGGRF